jgi:hypothetical protein
MAMTLSARLRLFYKGDGVTMCKFGKRVECRSSLPKSRSIEIASSKKELPSVTDAPAVAKPKFRYCDHGRANWPDVAASLLRRIDLSFGILRPPLRVAGAGNSWVLKIRKQCRVSEYEAVRLYAKAMLPGCLASARLRQFFDDRQSL